MTMEACDIADVCPLWTQNFAEGDPYGDAPERLCVWEGLGAGTLGRYRYVSDDEYSNGHDTTLVIMHVHAARKVTFVTHSFGEGQDENQESVKYDNYGSAMTCTLAAPELFESCPTDEPVAECYWLYQVTPWFTDCVADGPKCE